MIATTKPKPVKKPAGTNQGFAENLVLSYPNRFRAALWMFVKMSQSREIDELLLKAPVQAKNVDLLLQGRPYHQD